MITLTGTNRSIHFVDYICVGSVAGLLSIWVLPNTIALRHVFLVTGFLSACWIIYRSSFFRGRSVQELLPLYALSTLFIWVIIHYLFFSLNPVLEAQEITSLWLRSLLCVVIAIGLRISLDEHEKLQPYFFIALWFVPLVNLGAYLFISWRAGYFLLPSEFINAFTFKKIEAAFYGVLAVSIACANLIYYYRKSTIKKKTVTMIFWFSGILLAFASAIVANTKNGVVAIFGLCALLAISLLAKLFFDKKLSLKLWKKILAVSLTLVCLGAVWQVHMRFASPGWITLLEDIRIAHQIDKHDFWRYSGNDWSKKFPKQTLPKNSLDTPVAGNTYERVAWATVGVHLINLYPYGYGSVNQSFKKMLDFADIRHELQSQTHSGWIDFGLAYGVPGLIIFTFIFFIIFISAIWRINQFSLMGLWLILGIAPFGLIAEITYKHNFETLIFFLSLACSFTITHKSSFEDLHPKK